MTTQKYPRGSEWRKWDLHFHTPSSYDYKFKAATNDQIIDKMIEAGVGAFAVTDHHVMDVCRIKELQKIAAGRITVFPGIELRTELGGSSQVHMIGIFSEDCNLDDTWSEVSVRLGITKSDVQRKGDHSVYVDFAESSELIRRLGGIVTVHAGRKSNSIEGIKNSEVYKRAIKTDLLRKDVDILEVGQASDSAGYQNIVFKQIGVRLPICVFSDNHDIREYKVNEPCWIKADPTFRGLQQIIHEPEDRVFIGQISPSVYKTSRRATRIIRELEIRKIKDTTITEKWFDCQLSLNNELVAVIGNKGSGKSALSDIIGLLGNTTKHGSFSFLTTEKFRQSRNNKARNFYANLIWEDGTKQEVLNLNNNPESGVIEQVKYIPQSYLENICNEIGSGKGEQFYDELQHVIFSHISNAERLNFETLNDLLKYRCEETNAAIAQFKEKLHDINSQIVATEERSLPHHRKAIESQQAEKQRELNSHLNNRPVEITKPDANPIALEQSKSATDDLEMKQKEQAELEQTISDLTLSDISAAKKVSTAEKILGKIKNFERVFEDLIVELESDFKELDINIQNVIRFDCNTKEIDLVVKNQGDNRKSISLMLSAETNDGPVSKLKEVLEDIEKIQNKLSAPQQAFQSYIQALKEWESVKSKLIGTEDTPGSITYFQKQLNELDNLPTTLKRLRKLRNRKLLEIYREKKNLKAYYEKYYGAVKSFLKNHPIINNESFQLNFNVSMLETGFSDEFLSRLNRAKYGPFMGIEEGTATMKGILNHVNFDSALGTLRFTNNLFSIMSNKDGTSIYIKDQLKQGYSVQEIYDFVFSLDFISPVYNIQLDGKNLDQLSPGERGNLLLIFYLLIDQDDIPLIIDQPEENLDNQTVFKTLVPCIKDAKKRRQIVMVTHNPNLAVVCDAEQIIWAEMQKEEGNAVKYISGSIEDPIINAKIVDILEGTRPAFDKRDDKYHP